MVYKVKGVKNIYQLVGKEEYELQDYDFGVVSPEFCFLWKEGEKVNKKLIRELLKVKDDVEKIDKKG